MKAIVTKEHRGQLCELASNYELVSQELFRLSHVLETYPEYHPDSELWSLVRSIEVNTVNFRSLCAHMLGKPDNHSYYESVAENMRIQITEEHDWIKITVPAILPGRRRTDSNLYLTRPLRQAILAYNRDDPVDRFSECVICIVHCYDVALGESRVRDYDNIETKRFLDVIESGFLTNDSGLLCSVLQTSRIWDRDCTEFYLMAPQKLPRWSEKYLQNRYLNPQKNERKKGIDFAQFEN